MSMPIIDTVTPISPGELERRTFYVDIADEEGRRYRYNIPRLVAKLLQERADKIDRQGAALVRIIRKCQAGCSMTDIIVEADEARHPTEGHNQGNG